MPWIHECPSRRRFDIPILRFLLDTLIRRRIVSSSASLTSRSPLEAASSNILSPKLLLRTVIVQPFRPIPPADISASSAAAELADISAGGIGLKGWTITVLRSSFGERIFDDAASKGLLEVKDADEETIRLLIRVSRRKRRIGMSNLRRLGHS